MNQEKKQKADKIISNIYLNNMNNRKTQSESR